MSSFIPKFTEYIYERVDDELSSIESDAESVISNVSDDIKNIDAKIYETVDNAFTNIINKYDNNFITEKDLYDAFNQGDKLLSDEKFIQVAQDINNYSYSQSFYMYFIKYKNRLLQLINKLSLPSKLQKLFNTIKSFLFDNRFIKYLSKLLFASKDFLVYVVNFINKYWVNLVFNINFADWVLLLFTGVSVSGLISLISPVLASTYTFTMPILIYLGTITVFISVFISVAIYFKESQPGHYIIDLLHNKLSNVSNDFKNGILYIYDHIKNDLSYISFT